MHVSSVGIREKVKIICRNVNKIAILGQPYEGCTDEQVLELVQEDNYLEIPEFCPPAVYAQMVECFNSNPGRRPSFAELHSKFQAITIDPTVNPIQYILCSEMVPIWPSIGTAHAAAPCQFCPLGRLQ